MEHGYNVEVRLNDNVVTPSCGRRPSYQLIESIELIIGERWFGEYCLRIQLNNERLKELNSGEATSVKPEYYYELTTSPGDGAIQASGIVHRCLSTEIVSGRLVIRPHNLQTTVSELIHEAIGSLMLTDLVEYSDQSVEARFFSAARQLTPFTMGVGKSGPIDSTRFWMRVPSFIPELHGKRRFVVEMQPDGSREITGVYTNWTYGELLAGQPKVLFTDQANFSKQEDEPASIIPRKRKPKTFKPMTDKEVFEQFKKITFPVVE